MGSAGYCGCQATSWNGWEVYGRGYPSNCCDKVDWKRVVRLEETGAHPRCSTTSQGGVGDEVRHVEGRHQPFSASSVGALQKEAFLLLVPGAIGGVAGALRAGEGRRLEGAKAGAKGATVGAVKALPEAALAAAGGGAGGALFGGPAGAAGGAAVSGLGTLAASGGMNAYDEYQKELAKLEGKGT